jgi:hypothetical protein
MKGAALVRASDPAADRLLRPTVDRPADRQTGGVAAARP